MKYIIKKQDLISVLGIVPDTKLTYCSYELNSEQVEKLKSNGCIVEEPKIIECLLLDDMEYEKKRSTWIKFKKKNITGRGIKVAILDNGIATEHFNVDFTQNYTTAALVGSHGTMTASIVRDLAPDCILHCVKVIDGVTLNEADLLEGLSYCLSNSVHIVNMSLSVTKTTAIETAINDLHAAGIVMFASTGNNTSPAEISYPAWSENVIAVNAVKEDGSYAYQNWIIPSGGIHGVHIACAGYGNRVVDYLGNIFGNSGTSFSSPFAAGIAALTLEEIGTSNIGKLRQVLFNKAVKQSNETAFGYGIINC